jgi:hypothetical protein
MDVHTECLIVALRNYALVNIAFFPALNHFNKLGLYTLGSPFHGRLISSVFARAT